MVIRWSRWSPQLALTPALAVTLVAFIGAIVWTIFCPSPARAASPNTRSTGRMGPPVRAPVQGRRLGHLAPEPRHPRPRLALAIVFGFILAAMIDREKRGEGFFRTVFLYPLAVSLIVTGVAWRWMFNPELGHPELPALASA